MKSMRHTGHPQYQGIFLPNELYALEFLDEFIFLYIFTVALRRIKTLSYDKVIQLKSVRLPER